MMSNRILRDYTDSEAVNNLSFEAESTFVRLIQKADDFGIYYGDALLLKSYLFPRKEITTEQVKSYLGECMNQNLIAFYEAEGKPWVIIRNFKQTVRCKKHRYPVPPEGILSPQEYADTFGEPPTADLAINDTIDSVFGFEEFWATYDKKVERDKCAGIYSKLDEDTRQKIKDVVKSYVQATPNVKYRKNPRTWLNGKCWNDSVSSVGGIDRSAKGF